MLSITPNPFTPQSGLEPKVLGGREGIIDEFLLLLKKREQGENFHLLMLGEWGMGKTSLLKFYKKLTQNKNFKAVYTSLPKVAARESSRDVLFSLLEEIKFGLGLSGQDKMPCVKSANISLTVAEMLCSIYSALNTELLLVMVDDIQNISALPQVLDILRLALSNEKVLSKTKYLFMLSSTPSGWEKFLQRHDPIGRFFRRKQQLKKLNYDNVESTIKKTLLNTGTSFSEEVIAKAWEHTEGHPYELQLLASHLYDNQSRGRVAVENWDVALLNTLKDLGIEYFSSLYARASEREREILNVLAEKKEFLTLSEIKDIIVYEKRFKKYPVASIKNFLYRLLNKELLLRDKEKRYRILDNMFAEYIIRFR